MLTLVPSKSRPKAKVRRAVFVCEHPDRGWVTLDRTILRRTWRSPLDECSQRANLRERAEAALRSCFRYEFEEFERGHMFLLRGLTDHVTECTVFRFGTMFDQMFRQLPDEHYLTLTGHRLEGELRHAIAQFTPLPSVRTAAE